MHWPRIRGLCSVSWCLVEGQWNGDQRRPMGRKAREGLLFLLYVSVSVCRQCKVLDENAEQCEKQRQK